MISKIITENGLAYEVLSILNRGSQGTIYKVQRKNKMYAAKIYHSVTELGWENLKQLTLQGAPNFSNISSYVWPLHIVVSPDQGFIMEFINLAKYRSVNQLDNYQVLSVVDRITISIEMMKSLLALHLSTGKIFGDLSPNNVLVDIETLSIKIVDVDSIGVSEFEVAGTSGYMSKKTLIDQTPSLESDVFAIFVLVHELIFRKHPFDGKFVEKFSTYEEGINQAILKDKNYVFDVDENENSLNENDKRTKVIWDFFIPDSLKVIFQKMFRFEIPLEAVIEQFENHMLAITTCTCGGKTMTHVCPKCYQTLEMK